MLRIPSFFKNQGAKQFEFTPRYYSSSKERIDELKRKYASQEEVSFDKDTLRDRFRGARPERRQSAVNYRVILYVIAFSLVAYYVLYN